MLLKRFLKFVNSIMKTNKPSLKFLLATVAADARTITGSNLRSILLNTGVQVVPCQTLGSYIRTKKLQQVPEGEEWKVPLLHSLLEIRSGEFKLVFDYAAPDDNDSVDDLLAHICTS